MNDGRKTRPYIKSRIAVKRDSTLQNKENVPNEASKKGVAKKVIKPPPTARKTLSSRKEDNAQVNPIVKSRRARGAPDFDRLHKKWETKLAKGKAVTKRANTKIEPFNLTKEVNATLEPNINLSEDFLEDDVDEPVNNLQEREIVQESTIACCSCGKSKQLQQVSTPATNAYEFKVPKSIRGTNMSSVKTKSDKKFEFEEDPFEFKPDNNALRSILNNDGIGCTPTKRTTFTRCSPSPFSQKRTSIYYTGPRPDQPLSAFDKRLSMRRAAAMMAKMRQRENSFEPSKTLVGVHEFGNKFTATTPLKELQHDHNANPECIPEETSEEDTTPNVETIALAPNCSSAAVENEVTWADTLKGYSQAQQDNFFPVEEEEELHEQLEEEDKEALLAQLEEEVRETLANAALNEHTNFPTEDRSLLNLSVEKSDPASIARPNISIPFGQRRDKSSIYRKLFASPSTERLHNDEAMVEPNDLNPAYLYTATSAHFDVNVPSNLSEIDCLLAQEEYQTKPTSITVPGSRDLCRPPSSSPLYGFPKGRQNECSSKRSRKVKRMTFSPSVLNNSRNTLLEDPGLHTSSTIGTSNKEMTSCSTFNCIEKAMSGNLWSAEPTSKEKEGEKHVSLVAAVSSSLNSKLRTKTFETDSAFKKIKPPNAKMIEHPLSSVTNSCTPVNERKVVVPIPRRPVVAVDHSVPRGAASQFISRHRQIVREALVKSQDHAQQILLDSEVLLCARNIDLLWKSDYSDYPRLVNPLAKLFNEGDERHFVPVLT